MQTKGLSSLLLHGAPSDSGLLIADIAAICGSLGSHRIVFGVVNSFAVPPKLTGCTQKFVAKSLCLDQPPCSKRNGGNTLGPSCIAGNSVHLVPLIARLEQV